MNASGRKRNPTHFFILQPPTPTSFTGLKKRICCFSSSASIRNIFMWRISLLGWIYFKERGNFRSYTSFIRSNMWKSLVGERCRVRSGIYDAAYLKAGRLLHKKVKYSFADISRASHKNKWYRYTFLRLFNNLSWSWERVEEACRKREIT